MTENTVSDRINDCEALPEIIRFSRFYGKADAGKEYFHIEDKNGCGVKKSQYHIMKKKGNLQEKWLRSILMRS